VTRPREDSDVAGLGRWRAARRRAGARLVAIFLVLPGPVDPSTSACSTNSLVGTTAHSPQYVGCVLQRRARAIRLFTKAL